METNEEINPYIEKATEAGWRPLEEFDGDKDKWVDAEEFVKRAPLYEKNHKLSKKITDLEKTLFELKTHIGKVSEAAYNKAKSELEAQRDEAIDMGDKDQVKAIDKAIKDAETLKPGETGTPPEIVEWESVNGKWFYADEDIKNFGLAFMSAHLTKYPGDIGTGLEKMEAAIKKAYPDKFENPKRKEPPSVETGGTGSGKAKFTRNDLSEEQRKVVDRFVRQGVMKEEDYIKQLAEAGELGGKK